MKILKFVLGIIIVVGLALLLFKDLAVRVAVRKAIRTYTGLDARIGAAQVGLTNGTVRLRDIEIRHPFGFEPQPMLDIPVVYVNYDLSGLLSGRVHLYEARFHLQDFHVVKNEAGRVNLQDVKPVREMDAGRAGKKAPPEPATQAVPLAIERLELIVDKVRYTDYTRGGGPVTEEYPLGLNETYRDVSDPRELTALIISRALVKTAVGGMIDIDLQNLQRTFRQTAEKAVQEGAAEIEKSIEEGTRQLFDLMDPVQAE